MKLSIIGTGFISKAFLSIIHMYKDIDLQYILTRRDIKSITDFPYKEKITNDIDKVIKSSEIIFECSGDPRYAFNVCNICTKSGLLIATMNSEFHITYGSKLLSNTKNYITECQGDQPGSFIAFSKELYGYGFDPFAYLNFKRFLNTNPSRYEMEYWSSKQNISIDQVVAATDGTKVQIELCLISNWLTLDMVGKEMKGINVNTLDQVLDHIDNTNKHSNFVVGGSIPKGIGIVCKHLETQTKYLNYYGVPQKNNNYLLYKPFHLCHLEVIHTIRDLYQGKILLNNTKKPTMNVFTICKTKIPKGTKVYKSIGSFEFRGVIGRIKDHNGDIPIGELSNCVISKDLEPGQVVKYSDIENEM